MLDTGLMLSAARSFRVPNGGRHLLRHPPGGKGSEIRRLCRVAVAV